MNEKPALGDALSDRVREETLAAHQAAERAEYVQDLMAGRLSLDAFIHLVVQHHAIYSALDAVAAANSDPELTPFLNPVLARVDALGRDLEFLAGPGWEDRYPRLATTDDYVVHIEQVCGASSTALLAHHYTRYMGDLSGGQVIGRVMRRTYDLKDHRGTEFYDFPELPSAKAFKDAYRANLDALGWDAARTDEFIAEVDTAFNFNRLMFEGLTMQLAVSD